MTGCDANVYPPMSTQLAALGIELTEGYDAGAARGVANDADVFVIGNVVSRGNPLIEAILDAGPAYMSGPQWLAENVLRGKWVLAVAGTHGKTTTTAMLAWILEHAGLAAGIPDRRRRRSTSASRRGSPTAHSSSSRPTNTTPRSSTSARSSCTTGRARRSSTISNTTTPTSFPTSRRSRRSSTISCARCRATGRLIVNGGEASLRARAGARLLERGRALRHWPSGRPAPDADWTIAVDGTSSSAARRRDAARPFALTRPAQPAERARRDRRGAARRRAGRRMGSPRSRRSAASSAGWSCAARSAASPSTTISRIIRPRSRRRSTACAARSAARASSRCSSRARTR